MLNMLRTRKWVGLTCLALLIMVGFGFLSRWQWERAQRDMITSQPLVPLDQLVKPGTPLAVANYGSRVEVTGVFNRDHQVLVRRDSTTFVVVTPLTAPSGATVAVARGTVASADDPVVRTIPSGSVTVVGTIQPFDGDPGGESTLPPGQVNHLTAAAIGVSPLVGGWISESPAEAGFTETAVAYGPAAGTGLRAQNVTYAIQWILFAGCVVFFWWRLLRDDVNDAIATEGSPSVTRGSVGEPAGQGGSEQMTQSSSNPSRKKVY
jgi:cytochrome oxidase assembly protein ShyY1